MIDMLSLLALADKLGGRAAHSDRYDEIVLNPEHRKRFKGPIKLETRISSDPAVPEGIGVFREAGKVIGAIDFQDKRTMFINNPTEYFEISEKSK